MFKMIDSFIDRITMYKLVLYYLIALLAIAVGLSAVGALHYKPLYIVGSTAVLVATCWIVNKVFAYIFAAPTNSESSLITALILALIITPDFSGFNFLFLLAAPGLAIASKYLLTIRKKHIFNPVAIAVALTAIGPKQTASWWVGTAVMLPFVVLGGLLIARKIRHGRMILSFFVMAILATIFFSLLSRADVISSLQHMAVSSSIFFLGFVMLTEPLTSPTSPGKQVWYAALVGFLLPPQVRVFNFYSSPELALLVGNIFAYLVSSKVKLFPVLTQKVKVANNTADFVFDPGRRFRYKPGQYMEWTLPHAKMDSRGSRRYLTLASSPTEKNIRIGVKFYENGSSFKKALLDMGQHTPIVAAQIAGDFVLPKNRKRKLVFIAGGIGITPFRSMAKYLIDTNDQRDVTLLYSVRSEADIAYARVFEEARQKIGMRTTYVVTGAHAAVSATPNVRGELITPALIRTAVPDYLERTFYISGTHNMVLAMQDNLLTLGVHKRDIKTDFFPGYA